jgi:hypothetical protein
MSKASAILLSDKLTQDLFEIEAGEKMTISNQKKMQRKGTFRNGM